MYRDKRIAVVVPCYRVADRISTVIQTLPAFVDDVVVVDDGSIDNLVEAVKAARDPRVVLLRHPSNRGLHQAMITGFGAALKNGADIVVKMDGDGQMDPAHLPRLLDPIVRGQADLTKGNRLLHRRHLPGMPAVRLVGNLGLSFLAKAASGYWNIFDATNGYVALRRSLLLAINFDRLGPRYFFESSLLTEVYLADAVVRDISLPARYGQEPTSLSIWQSLLQFPFLLLRAAARRILIRYFLREFTPVALFLITGTALLGFGLTFGITRWVQNMGTNIPTPAGTVVVALLPTLLGFQLLLQAVVMDIANVPRESVLVDADDEGPGTERGAIARAR